MGGIAGRAWQYLWLAICLGAAAGCGNNGGGGPGEDLVDGRSTDEGRGLETTVGPDAPGEQSAPEAVTENIGEDWGEPLPWSAERTVVVDDRPFVKVAGERFFSIGFHGGSGAVYDGIAGPGECDKATGVGYLDINIEKTHAAAEAGANLIFLWGYDGKSKELLAVEPRFKGRWHGLYSQVLPVEDDVIPVFYNEHGEVDLDGFNPDKVDQMAAEFDQFINRTGKFSPEAMPHLPPVEQVGHMGWHPTFRMIGTGDGKGEMLTSEQADSLAQTMNMMIGDTYTYVENRFDWGDPVEAVMAAATGQKGEKGEGYAQWLEWDDPAHRSMFTSGFDLTHSLVTRGKPGTVVWMWVQGYSFGDSIKKSECQGKPDDSWATGGFPTPDYLRKEIASMVAAGATGIIFFGFSYVRWPEAEVMLDIFRTLAHPEIYGPALLSPRLELGIDTLFVGDEGYDGRGRAHLAVTWDEQSRRALIVGGNPGARATAVTLPFPWTIAQAELWDWQQLKFVASPDLIVNNRTLDYEFPRDSGQIIRITPLFE